MENFFGIIIFILFIALRAMGDRRRGMKKQPARKKTRSEPVVKHTTYQKEPVPLKKVPMEKPRLEPRRLEPVSIGQPEMKRAKPNIVLGEGESGYDDLPNMEGVELEKPIEEIGAVASHADSVHDRYILSGDDLRKAVVWSEVLQKPRFRTKPGILPK